MNIFDWLDVLAVAVCLAVSAFFFGERDGTDCVFARRHDAA